MGRDPDGGIGWVFRVNSSQTKQNPKGKFLESEKEELQGGPLAVTIISVIAPFCRGYNPTYALISAVYRVL